MTRPSGNTQHELGQRLRDGAVSSDARTYAAANLLVEQGYWLRHREFIRRCVFADKTADVAWIRWRDAAAFLAEDPLCSTTERAVLEFAVALGTDQFRLGNLGNVHARLFATAMIEALYGPGETTVPVPDNSKKPPWLEGPRP